MSFITGAIKDKGGNLTVLTKVTEAFATVTPVSGTTSYNLGHLKNSNFNQTANKTEYKSEDGVTRATDFDYSIGVTGVLMQRDKSLIDFLSETVKGNYYLLYKNMGVVNGKYQELFMLGQVTPQNSIDLPGGAESMPFEFTGLYPETTITITGTFLSALETALSIAIRCTGASITSSQGFVIKETNV